jgi:hypothetical protein
MENERSALQAPNSPWLSSLTGTADELLLFVCLELCLYIHIRECLRVYEGENGSNNKNVTETKPIKVNYARRKLVFRRVDNTASCCYLE